MYNFAPRASTARAASAPQRRQDYADDVANFQSLVVAVESQAADLGRAIIDAFAQVGSTLLAIENDPAYQTGVGVQEHNALVDLNGRLDALASYIEQAVLEGENY